VLDPPQTVRTRTYFLWLHALLGRALAITMIAELVACWLLIALLIKLDSRGPVLFVNRVWTTRKTLLPYKFRSMHPLEAPGVERADVMEISWNADHDVCAVDGLQGGVADSTRITRVGLVLRCSSLDELPQLWNILVGNLSFVGPRLSLPDRSRIVQGVAQARLSYLRAANWFVSNYSAQPREIEAMIESILAYIRSSSFWLDFKILCQQNRHAILSGM